MHACLFGQALQDSLSQHNGLAPKAKVCFYDFKPSGDAMLNVPDDLFRDLFLDSYVSGGARLASMSWGAEDGTYNQYAYDTDRFVHTFPDYLPLFAAGNYGDRGYNSLSSPGICKNVLTVGASKNMAESFTAKSIGTGRDETDGWGLFFSPPSPLSSVKKIYLL